MSGGRSGPVPPRRRRSSAAGAGTGTRSPTGPAALTGPALPRLPAGSPSAGPGSGGSAEPPTGRVPSEPVELAPSESAGQGALLQGQPAARRGVLGRLKTRGEATAQQLAADLGVTVAAVRQQLGSLGEDGLVAHRDERPSSAAQPGRARPGRPQRWYCLTPAAEALFPKRYGQLTNQLLGFIGAEDPALVAGAFERRGRQREERASARLAGLGLDARVAELARILDEDGYLAGYEPIPGGWRITELNCAILDVARQHHQACGSELDFLRTSLPGATVERVTHILGGAHACSYEVRPRPR